MLTHTSTAAAKAKMLLFIPLALVCIICFSQNSFSQKFERNGNVVTYRDNKFELSKPDTIYVDLPDPVSGKTERKMLIRDPYPIKMNGKPIFQSPEQIISKPDTTVGSVFNEGPGINNNSLKEYLFSNLKEYLAKLKDTTYSFSMINIVIDDKGKIVYYEYGGINIISNTDNGNKLTKIERSLDNKITKKIQELMENAPIHNPASVNNKDVPSLISSGGNFTIKGHKIIKL